MKVQQKPDPKFAYWHGIPREQIPWYPTIDEQKCIGCKLCFVSCGRNVFSFDTEKHKAVVTKPYNCMVGCSTCATICPVGAISFPDKELIHKIEKEYKILGRIQKKARAKLAMEEYNRIRAKVLEELEKNTTRFQYEITGHILERRFLEKLKDYIEDKPLDIADIKLHTPSIKACWDEKAPSYLSFVLTSTEYEDIENYSKEIDDMIKISGCIIIEKRKMD